MTKRRDKGSGTVFRDTERGGFRAEIRLDGKVYVRRGKTKAQATDRLNALIRDHARGTLSVDQTTTVGTLVDHYLSRTIPNRKGGNLSKTALYRYRWAGTHIKEHLGKRRASSLTVSDVEKMLDRIGLRRYSLTVIRNVLVDVLGVAVRRGDLSRNVAELAELPGEVKSERKRESLSLEMANRLIDGCESDRLGVMFALQIVLAARPGEIAGLFWQDIDLDNGIVNITRGRQTDERGRVSISDELKTSKSKRTLEIPQSMVAMLQRHRSRQLEERLASENWVDDRLVFTSTVGSLLDSTSVRRHLKRLCEELGVCIEVDGAKRVPVPYELRHTGTSLYSAVGVAQEQIADLLGLTSTRMIESRYRHRLRPTIDVASSADFRAM